MKNYIMRLRKRILIWASTPIVALSTIPVVGCSQNKTPKVVNVQKMTSNVYTMQLDDTGKTIYQKQPDENNINLCKFNNSEVAYIDVDYYVLNAMDGQMWFKSNNYVKFTSSTKDYVTKITNPHTSATCEIDYRKQTITFSDYDSFLCYDKLLKNPLTRGCATGENYYYSIEETYNPGGVYTINISDYNIPLYYYDNHGYIPYDLYRNIIDPYALLHFFFDGNNFYEIIEDCSEETKTLYNEIAKKATTINKQFMEYTYNLFALTLDNRFGLLERPSRVYDGKTIKYFPNGAYKTLEPYHDKLVSLEKNVSNNALFELFDKEIDDGGHAAYYSTNLLTDIDFTIPDNKSVECLYTEQVEQKIEDARKTMGCDPFSITGNDKATAYYKEYKCSDQTIPYITFDNFSSNGIILKTKEEDKQRCLPELTNENNYYTDTIRLTMYANQQIKQGKKDGKNIKNVVLDISNNGGGLVFVEHFIASWLCNGITQKIYNPHTKAYSEYTVKADIDGDGKFNANDYIGDDIKIYLITSPKTFSCGNALACNLKDSNKSTYIIGDKSGGGACFVDKSMHIGLGNTFRSCSNFHILRKSSKAGNYISVESGVDSDYKINPIVESIKFFERDKINQKIVESSK